MNRREGPLHELAVSLLIGFGRDALVPWPVPTAVDLLLRKRGYRRASLQFVESLLAGTHRLYAPTESELRRATELGKTYEDLGVDLPDLVVMAIALNRDIAVLT